MRHFAFLTLCLFMLGVALPARAHGYLVRAIPADRAALDRAPARVQYWFSEALEPTFSRITVRDAAGTIVAEGGVDDNPAAMSARLPTTLGDGVYVTELRVAFASDGHVTTAFRSFAVGVRAETAFSGSAYSITPLEIVWRAGLYAGLTLLLGTAALYVGVLVPAWGSGQYRAGGLAPRLMRRLDRVLVGAFALTAAAHVLALVQQAMTFFDADAVRVVSDGLWSAVRVSTRFGDVWSVRTVLLGAAFVLWLASRYVRREYPELVSRFWTANVWLFALMVGTLSAASHAAGSLTLAWVAVAANWTHTVAVGLWVGGVFALALVVPVALAPYAADARRRALAVVLSRFSQVALVAVVVVVATGVYSALNWFTAPADLPTAYGAALGFKLALVLLLVGVGAAQYLAARPAAYVRWARRLDRVRLPQPPFAAFALALSRLDRLPLLRAESVLALPVFGAVALLAATPPPVPAFASVTHPPLIASASTNDVTLTASVAPGGTGVNTVDLLLRRGDVPVEAAVLRARLLHPASDRRTPWLPVDAVGGGLYTVATDAVDREGTWWLQVQNSAPPEVQPVPTGGSVYAFAFDFTRAAAVPTALAPNVVQVAALFGVVGALGFAAAPRLRRLWAALDLRPAAVTIALGTVAATALLLVVGARITDESSAAYQRRLNPPPALVNPTLPDRRSIVRGDALLVQRCPAWLDGADAAALVRRLDRTRDDELVNLLATGWRTLPACDLSPDERWDVINALRIKTP